MENLALGKSLGHLEESSSRNIDKHTIADFTTRSDGVSDSEESTMRSEGKYTNNIHQMCVIITEAVEDNDGRNNTVANMQGDNPENNHRKERKKIRLDGRVEDDHINNQSRHGATLRIREEKF
jgi:hypothetical protein